jgi:3-phenylpropionate/cinnamic acid dioxygenase small subunit
MNPTRVIPNAGPDFEHLLAQDVVIAGSDGVTSGAQAVAPDHSPVAPQQTEWEGSPSIFAEDKLMMEIRKGRVTHPNAWSQAPAWETSHLVSHVAIESASQREVVVRSRFHMMELRRDQIRHFGGSYRHTLVRHPAGLRIRLQRVDLFNSQAPFDYVLQIWV